jgi:molecular chaperone HtpG
VANSRLTATVPERGERGIAVAVEEQKFKIQLEGLIKLLAQNLYADPDVFLRELIQNAHDSISRRAALAEERGETELPSPRIQVVASSSAATIDVHDNGSGLTREEIDDYLSTIGRSGTDELRRSELQRRILEGDRSRTIDLIGQFGIGLLSAFIVAERVTVLTRAPGHDALLWESQGGAEYRVEPGTRQLVGTTITLHIRPEHGRYLDRSRLQEIIRSYADFIGVPVFVDDDAEPTNAVTAPWHRNYPSPAERDAAYGEFWERKFLGENALHVFAVDEAFEWEDFSDPEGKGHGRVRGVLAITDRRVPDVNARGIVDIYINRMFISAGNREVLPPWGKFLQGVLECNELTPNAARDNVVRNAALAAVQQVLGTRIVHELMELSHLNHARFIEIMRWHAYHVLAMAVQPEYEDFFRSVADIMPLESDQGPMTVPEYARSAATRTDGSKVVYYITERGSANQYFLLANARSMRVFSCAEPFAELFLQRYAEIWPDRIHLSRLDLADSDTIFEPLEGAEQERFAELLAAYNVTFNDLRFVPRVSRFKPAEVPAVLTETRDGKNRRDLETFVENVAVPPIIRGILGGFLNEKQEPRILHLNADNPTIQKLADWPNLRDEVSRHALVSLYNNAVMLLARSLRVQDVRAMFEQYSQVIEVMLSLATERAEFERTLNARDAELEEFRVLSAGDDATRDPYVSCFVAMPFSDESATGIYEGLRAVLEDRPYYWGVVRADSNVEKPGLWANLKAKLLRAHCYVAILGRDVNPNVMIEIGRMEALERPLIILRDPDGPDLPADLGGLLYADIDPRRDDVRDQVREAIAKHEPLRTLRGERYLSETVLTQEALLNEQVSREISRAFPTWRSLLDADTDQVARQFGMNRLNVEALKQTLESIN